MDAITILGVHGPHYDDELPEFFNDLSFLLSGRQSKSKTIAMGDWNIDELPALSIDPFRNELNRSDHHSFKRAIRDSWMDAHHFLLYQNYVVDSIPHI